MKQNANIDDDRTFFCSELVAKTFKVCNIMQDGGEASSNYLPSNFSTPHWNISLKPGVKVQDERNIVISERYQSMRIE